MKFLWKSWDLRREQWHELCYMEKIFTQEECKAKAEQLLDDKIQNADKLDVINVNETVNETPGGIRVTRYVTFVREISEEREILFR